MTDHMETIIDNIKNSIYIWLEIIQVIFKSPYVFLTGYQMPEILDEDDEKSVLFLFLTYPKCIIYKCIFPSNENLIDIKRIFLFTRSVEIMVICEHNICDAFPENLKLINNYTRYDNEFIKFNEIKFGCSETCASIQTYVSH